jgi:hypothetical protein
VVIGAKCSHAVRTCYNRSVALVELRGREDEPEVRELLGAAVAHGWIPLGWERDGRIAACVALERRSPETLAVRLLAFEPQADRVAIGRLLFDALAAVAAAARLVADVEPGTVELYRACGFALDGARAIRPIETVPAPAEAVAALTPAELERAIRAAWGRDTSADPGEWSETNPARGQCDVTALLVRELLGGEILIANVIRAGRRVERHAWNRLPSGLTVDLTREQFLDGEAFEAPVVQEPLALSRSSDRLDLLRARVRDALGHAPET